MYLLRHRKQDLHTSRIPPCRCRSCSGFGCCAASFEPLIKLQLVHPNGATPPKFYTAKGSLRSSPTTSARSSSKHLLYSIVMATAQYLFPISPHLWSLLEDTLMLWNWQI